VDVSGFTGADAAWILAPPQAAWRSCMIRIMVVCDIRIYREGLAHALEQAKGFHVEGAVDHVEAAAQLAGEVQPDIVLLDMGMSGSRWAVSAIEGMAPASRVVALCVPETEDQVIACIDAGVSSYLSQDASLEDLVRVVETTARGEAICSPKMIASLFRELARRGSDIEPDAANGPLTSREREILALIDRGLSNGEIARALHIAVSTVKNHVHNILAKRGVHRRVDALSRLHRERSNAVAFPRVDLVT
jgi:two-component system, NarL family, nitrate/nitrite response regulator NarL